MLTAHSKPRLRHCTLIDDPNGVETTLVVGTDYFTMTRDGDRAKFLQLKSMLDGRHAIATISEKTGLDLRSVLGVVEALQEAGLFQERHESPTVAVDDFKTRVEASSLMWRRQIGLHPMFSGLAAGQYRREVFIGLLFETYHYVFLLPRMLKELADEHMRAGPYRDCVMEYAREEMDHYLDYRTSLLEIDRLAAHIDDAHPTVGTLSLIRNFESIGRRDELSLICCLQLIEARPSEMDGAESDLLGIAARYDMTPLMAPFLQHMRADITLGHSNLLSRALADIDHLSSDAVHRAVNDMHDLKHCYDVFHDSIISYYADISNYIPRPRVDYFAL